MINGFDKTTAVFAGEGDLIMFDPIEDYNEATFNTLAYPRSLGQIVQDSTEVEGGEAEITHIMDEKGAQISTNITPSSFSFSFDIASTSFDMVREFLKGERLPNIESQWDDVIGFGVDMPVMTRPLMIMNDLLNRAWLYPKSKIISTLTYDDDLWCIHATVTVEYLDTPYLKSCMIIEGDIESDDLFYFGDLLCEDSGLMLLEDGGVLLLSSE